MANLINPAENNVIKKLFTKIFQSGNINFLIGSGASSPAISVAGNIEKEIEELFKAGNDEDADKKIYDFLLNIQTSTNDLIQENSNANNDKVLEGFKGFLEILNKILIERKTNLLPRQANIFTTNYDLFVEKAAQNIPILKLNDGFSRTPRIDSIFTFSSQNFFNSVFNSGNLYNYKVEIPCLNLIKIHGSLSWKKIEVAGDEDNVVHSITIKPPLTSAAGATISNGQIKNYNKEYAIILPQKSKFRETLMDRIYYDLLRIYANELDKENTLLIAFGFSFIDEHIYDITRRALKNPTLKLIIFAYKEGDVEGYQNKFHGYNNVDIIKPQNSSENIDFKKFNEILGSVFNAENNI